MKTQQQYCGTLYRKTDEVAEVIQAPCKAKKKTTNSATKKLKRKSRDGLVEERNAKIGQKYILKEQRDHI